MHRLIKLRHRHIYTRNNRLRVRYIAGGSVSAMLAAFMVFGQGSAMMPSMPSFEVTSADAAMVAEINSAAGWEITNNLQNQISSGIRKASLAIKKTEAYSEDLKIKSGDTIAGVLESAGVSSDDAYKAVKALSAHINPRQVQVGQAINVHFKPDSASEGVRLASMTMEDGPLRSVTVNRDEDNFTAELAEQELKSRTYAGYAKVQNSLYGSAERAGIPSKVLSDVIRLYSRSVDFQRDIHQGDAIEVMYDGEETADGSYKRYGNILYANLIIDGKNVPLYRFEDKDGNADYYDEKGNTTRKTLMKTPIDGARVSSGFGMRRHPILGYTKMHKGVDFAAPTGTPIYAAGDGTLEFVGRKNGYGNFIAIRHNSEIKTAYGHMYRFANGMKRGGRVRQGEVIGYVGSTGRATGPHLHYEVVKNGQQINPRSIDLPAGDNLRGRELDRFKRSIRGLHQQYVYLTQSLKVALGDDNSSDNLN